jgi:hypothetical protein
MPAEYVPSEPMLVHEMITLLLQLQAEGKGNYGLFDTNGYPVIHAHHGDETGSDLNAGKVFIEAEF